MRLFYAVAIALLAGYGISFSQTVTIRGKVKTDVDSVLAGVSVSIKGTAISTITDKNGEFSIAVPERPARLMFSSVGYRTKEFIVKGTDSSKYIYISLNSIGSALDEVVVTGYGIAKRRDVTGRPATRQCKKQHEKLIDPGSRHGCSYSAGSMQRHR